jgi:hypothetical protein
MAQHRTDSSAYAAVLSNYYESPPVEPTGDEIWCYSDRLCYSPGETIAFHVSTTAKTYSLEIARDPVTTRYPVGGDLQFKTDGPLTTHHGSVEWRFMALTGQPGSRKHGFKR